MKRGSSEPRPVGLPDADKLEPIDLSRSRVASMIITYASATDPRQFEVTLGPEGEITKEREIPITLRQI